MITKLHLSTAEYIGLLESRLAEAHAGAWTAAAWVP
jgi:hypothetical protein